MQLFLSIKMDIGICTVFIFFDVLQKIIIKQRLLGPKSVILINSDTLIEYYRTFVRKTNKV